MSIDSIELFQRINSAAKMLKSFKDEKTSPSEFLKEAQNHYNHYKTSKIALKIHDLACECSRVSRFIEKTQELEKALVNTSIEEKWLLKYKSPRLLKTQVSLVVIPNGFKAH